LSDLAANLRLFQRALEGPLKEFAEKKYPDYMRQYNRFRERNGPTCPFCKAAAKFIYMSEFSQKGPNFIDRVKSEDWTNYE
jgi:hypothetical protein